MFRNHHRQKLIVALLALVLLSVPVLSQHSHDGLSSEANCVLCAFQTFDDTDLKSTLTDLSQKISQGVIAKPIQLFSSSSTITPIARGPPKPLIG